MSVASADALSPTPDEGREAEAAAAESATIVAGGSGFGGSDR
jgi:hypothetical protein